MAVAVDEDEDEDVAVAVDVVRFRILLHGDCCSVPPETIFITDVCSDQGPYMVPDTIRSGCRMIPVIRVWKRHPFQYIDSQHNSNIRRRTIAVVWDIYKKYQKTCKAGRSQNVHIEKQTIFLTSYANILRLWNTREK